MSLLCCLRNHIGIGQFTIFIFMSSSERRTTMRFVPSISFFFIFFFLTHATQMEA